MIGTSLDQGDEIDALIKLPPSARDALIERACAGEAVSAKARLKELTVTVKHVPAPAAEPNVLRVVQSVKPPEEFDPQSIRDKILALPDIDLNKLQGFFEALQRSHSPEMVELARQVAIEALSEKLERIRCALAWLEGRKPPGFSDTKH